MIEVSELYILVIRARLAECAHNLPFVAATKAVTDGVAWQTDARVYSAELLDFWLEY